jgi:uncharacterized protein (TIGR02246 family)
MNHLARRGAVAATILLGVFAASARATPPFPETRAEIESASNSYARFLKAQDAEKLAALFTSDGELMNPGMDTLRGPEAIRKFLLTLKDVKVEQAEMLPGTIDAGATQAMQWGTYTQRVVLPGRSEPLAVAGRYVADWRKQSDGRWLLRRMLTQPEPVRPRE